MATNPVKVHLSFGISDFYKDYKKSVTKDKKFNLRDRQDYKDYVYDVFAEIFNNIVKDSWHFVLPFGLGEFYMKEAKPKNNMDGSFRTCVGVKYGKKIYTDNRHTFGKMFRFTWDRTYAFFPNSKYYKFKIFEGKNKIHRKYKVGRMAIRDFLFSIGNNPLVKMIKPYNKPVRVLEEPTYENQIH